MAKRSAGILLAISSLSGGGTLGEEAFAFVDFLAASGQSFWQILPIGPVGKTLSPYQSSSAFAGNPAFIDQSLVRREQDRYMPKGPRYRKFLKENATWLDDFALFEAVLASQKNKPLSLWPEDLRNASAETLGELRKKHRMEIDMVRHEQYCFFTQWKELRRYANRKGIGIIGDLPIYVYENSAEFWLRRSMFDVDSNGRPASLAGVPPDKFSKKGQLWNNPVYDWDKHGDEVMDFWRNRLAQSASLYDGVRIDHFRAFADYYAIRITYAAAPSSSVPGEPSPSVSGEPSSSVPGEPSSSVPGAPSYSVPGAPNTKCGEWRPGPGTRFTDMVHKEFPRLFVIAEDLGKLSKEAKKFVKECGIPRMSVMQFAFSGKPKNPYLPHNIRENSVCYTGTHDNDTLLGWLRGLKSTERRYAMAYFGLSRREDLRDAILAAALACMSATTIIPMQDWLSLGSSARTNTPGTAGGRNWKWRIPKGALTPHLAARIRHLTKDLYGR